MYKIILGRKWMAISLYRTWIEIKKSSIKNNVKNIKAKIPIAPGLGYKTQFEVFDFRDINS